MQKNAIFIFQKINFLNYTFYTRIKTQFETEFKLNLNLSLKLNLKLNLISI